MTDKFMEFIKKNKDKPVTMVVGEPKRISVDNGNTYVTPEDAIEEVGFEEIESRMDEDVKEQVHIELAPCTDVEFLTRYLELADHDLIIG